jgi:hypothetical protein
MRTIELVRIEPHARNDEVQLGKRTGRKRGAPPGNTNRLTHGRYAAAAVARRKANFARLRDAVLIERLSALLIRAHNAGLLR